MKITTANMVKKGNRKMDKTCDVCSITAHENTMEVTEYGVVCNADNTRRCLTAFVKANGGPPPTEHELLLAEAFSRELDTALAKAKDE
jgi:hypothetical protein